MAIYKPRHLAPTPRSSNQSERKIALTMCQNIGERLIALELMHAIEQLVQTLT